MASFTLRTRTGSAPLLVSWLDLSSVLWEQVMASGGDAITFDASALTTHTKDLIARGFVTTGGSPGRTPSVNAAPVALAPEVTTKPPYAMGGGSLTSPAQLSGTINIDLSHGSRQACALNGNTTFVLPSGSTDFDTLDLLIQYSGGQTVNFSNVYYSGDSSLSFPMTLVPWRAYRIRLEHIGGNWQLVSFVGNFTENMD